MSNVPSPPCDPYSPKRVLQLPDPVFIEQSRLDKPSGAIRKREQFTTFYVLGEVLKGF